MTQSQCFDAVIQPSNFFHYTLPDSNYTHHAYSAVDSRSYHAHHTTINAEVTECRRTSPVQPQYTNILKMMAASLTITFLIFNLPFILTIGHDVLLTVVLLSTAPMIYQTRYGILLHVAAIWSLIYTLRTLVQPYLNPFYYIANLFICTDQIRISLHNIESHAWRAVGSICAIVMTVMVLITNGNSNLSWRTYTDIAWLIELLVVMWHSD